MATLGMDAGLSPRALQTPGTTSVSSAPGLSAPAATCSSTGASILERSPCSECVEGTWGVRGMAGYLGSSQGPFLSRCPWLRCEICGFTCRQKASLNWHQRKHAETVAALRFPCEVCGKRFEKPDSVTAHCSKSHPALLLAPPESPHPLEPCPSTCAPVPLGSSDGGRPSEVPQAPTLLPQQ